MSTHEYRDKKFAVILQNRLDYVTIHVNKVRNIIFKMTMLELFKIDQNESCNKIHQCLILL